MRMSLVESAGAAEHARPEARAYTIGDPDRERWQQQPSAQSMITLPGLAADALGSFLADDMKDRFGVSHARLAEIIPFAARLALGWLGYSGALYHKGEQRLFRN